MGDVKIMMTVLRKSVGWSCLELAAESGLRPAVVAGIEAGKVEPTPGQLRAIARALDDKGSTNGAWPWLGGLMELAELVEWWNDPKPPVDLLDTLSKIVQSKGFIPPDLLPDSIDTVAGLLTKLIFASKDEAMVIATALMGGDDREDEGASKRVDEADDLPAEAPHQTAKGLAELLVEVGGFTDSEAMGVAKGFVRDKLQGGV